MPAVAGNVTEDRHLKQWMTCLCTMSGFEGEARINMGCYEGSTHVIDFGTKAWAESTPILILRALPSGDLKVFIASSIALAMSSTRSRGVPILTFSSSSSCPALSFLRPAQHLLTILPVGTLPERHDICCTAMSYSVVLAAAHQSIQRQACNSLQTLCII